MIDSPVKHLDFYFNNQKKKRDKVEAYWVKLELFTSIFFFPLRVYVSFVTKSGV